MGKLIYNTSREGYSVNQIRHTMMVGELISFLSDFDEDTPIYLGFDNCYTYGGITEYGFSECEDEEGEEEC